MKKCLKCGAVYSDEVSFCSKCGSSLVAVKSKENVIKKGIVAIYLILLAVIGTYVPYVYYDYSGSVWGDGDITGSISAGYRELSVDGRVDANYSSSLRRNLRMKGYDWCFHPQHTLFNLNGGKMKPVKWYQCEIDTACMLQEILYATALCGGFYLLVSIGWK